MTLAMGGMAATGALLSVRALASEKATVNMQLGWVQGNRTKNCLHTMGYEVGL
jgi:hypothetical protein